MKKMVKREGTEEGGTWECYKAHIFYGWEAENVVVMTKGDNLIEMITRARTHLVVILVDCYATTREYFLQAESKGLIDIVHLSAN